MGLLKDATWPDIEAFRKRLSIEGADAGATVEEIAARFAQSFATEFESIVLSRLFLVLPFEHLAPEEQAFARKLVREDERLRPKTPVLTLFGTAGKEPRWNDRRLSEGHRAIPLLDKSFVQGAPMLARLLGDLEVDLAGLNDGRPVATRLLIGGRNGTFYVPDAPTASDDAGRHIIPDQAFVARHGIQTVFGMGGAYVDGTLAVAILFSTEALPLSTVDRFASFISNFKITTLRLVMEQAFYSSDPSGARAR